ncbi:MAG: hypothetical protein V1848_00050 [Candidatus Magasanikbacteria bacterium]
MRVPEMMPMDENLESVRSWEESKKGIQEYTERLHEKWKEYFLSECHLDEDTVKKIFSLPQEIQTQLYEEYYTKKGYGVPELFERILEQINEVAEKRGEEMEHEFEQSLGDERFSDGKSSIDSLLGDALLSDTKEDHIDCDFMAFRIRALGYRVYHHEQSQDMYEKEMQKVLQRVYNKLQTTHAEQNDVDKRFHSNLQELQKKFDLILSAITVKE